VHISLSFVISPFSWKGPSWLKVVCRSYAPPKRPHQTSQCRVVDEQRNFQGQSSLQIFTAPLWALVVRFSYPNNVLIALWLPLLMRLFPFKAINLAYVGCLFLSFLGWVDPTRVLVSSGISNEREAHARYPNFIHLH